MSLRCPEHRPSTAALLAPLVLAALLAAPFAGAQEPTSDQASAETVLDPKAQRLEDAKAQVWWNQSRYADLLALTAEQRAGMDARLANFVEEQGEPKTRLLQRQLAEALEAGNWDAARVKTESLNSARAEVFTQQTELKIDILQMLQPNQREQLAKSFGRLLKGPWVRIPRGDGKNRPARRSRR